MRAKMFIMAWWFVANPLRAVCVETAIDGQEGALAMYCPGDEVTTIEGKRARIHGFKAVDAKIVAVVIEIDSVSNLSGSVFTWNLRDLASSRVDIGETKSGQSIMTVGGKVVTYQGLFPKGPKVVVGRNADYKILDLSQLRF